MSDRPFTPSYPFYVLLSTDAAYRVKQMKLVALKVAPLPSRYHQCVKRFDRCFSLCSGIYVLCMTDIDDKKLPNEVVTSS